MPEAMQSMRLLCDRRNHREDHCRSRSAHCTRGQLRCWQVEPRAGRHHVRSVVKTASWRAFAAVDTFGLVWLFSGHDTTHAIAAAGAVVGVEAITKSFLYFAHERLWEAPLLR